MANYCGVVRSNYFKVTNEIKFRKIIKECCSDSKIFIYENGDENGVKHFAIGCFDILKGVLVDSDNDEHDISLFYNKLQKVVSKDDAIIITEFGYEKLRYLIGACTVITHDNIDYVDVQKTAIALAAKLLKNTNYSTQMHY